MKLALSLALAFLAGIGVAGQQEPNDVLKGISSVRVSVDPLPETVVQLRVTETDVVGDADAAMKKAAIPMDKAAAAQLRVTINAVDIRTGSGSSRGVAFTVSVSVEQAATLESSGLATRVTTWRRAAIGVSNRTGARAAIRAQLAEYLGAFTTAWRTANRP